VPCIKLLVDDGKAEKRRGTYEVTRLSRAAGEDENGLWARAGASRFEFGAGGGLAGFKLADLKGTDLGALGSSDGGGDSQAGEEGGGEELHGEVCWWMLWMGDVDIIID
jgi:hypothetical protein